MTRAGMQTLPLTFILALAAYVILGGVGDDFSGVEAIASTNWSVHQ